MTPRQIRGRNSSRPSPTHSQLRRLFSSRSGGSTSYLFSSRRSRLRANLERFVSCGESTSTLYLCQGRLVGKTSSSSPSGVASPQGGDSGQKATSTPVYSSHWQSQQKRVTATCPRHSGAFVLSRRFPSGDAPPALTEINVGSHGICHGRQFNWKGSSEEGLGDGCPYGGLGYSGTQV